MNKQILYMLKNGCVIYVPETLEDKAQIVNSESWIVQRYLSQNTVYYYLRKGLINRDNSYTAMNIYKLV